MLPGGREYRWEQLELAHAPDQGWAHHGVGVLEDGSTVAATPDRACPVRLDRSGRGQSRLDLDLLEMHGITVSSDGRAERLFVADNGHKFVPGRPSYAEVTRPGSAAEASGKLTTSASHDDRRARPGTKQCRLTGCEQGHDGQHEEGGGKGSSPAAGDTD